jgi:hypothetical protein
MFDAFVGGALTLIVLFIMFCGVVIVIEYVPAIGFALLIGFGLVVVATLMSFADKRR